MNENIIIICLIIGWLTALTIWQYYLTSDIREIIKTQTTTNKTFTNSLNKLNQLKEKPTNGSE